MKITMEPTEHFTHVNGALVRLWSGMTDKGTPVKVFVKLIAVHNREDHTAFEQELMEVGPPAEALPIPLPRIFDS